MADELGGPKVLSFPLWRGQDTKFTARRKDPLTGMAVNYSSGTVAKIVFTSGKTVAEFHATIEGDAATFVIDHSQVTNIRNNATWRLQFTIDGVDESPVVGKVVRKDG